jgi:protein-arginine kinase activator protein McsA
MEYKIKPRRCKICSEVFTPNRPLIPVCSPKCAIEYSKKLKANKEKKERKIQIEKLKTHKDHLNELQKIFNTYIRERDKLKGCISCGAEFKSKFDAGHFFSVGAYPNLRFNLDNVHGQCVHCNQHKHGNISEYSIRLPERIGIKKFENLKVSRNIVTKLSIPEIEVLKIKYKELCKIISK